MPAKAGAPLQTNFAEKFLKAWFISDGFKAGIFADISDLVRMVLIRFFQPLKSFLLLIQPHVRARYMERRYVGSSGNSNLPFHNFLRRIFFPRLCINPRLICFK